MSDPLPPLPELTPGRYRHYKGGEYEVVGVARHSETLEPLVVYRPLYNASGLWVRPHAMFVEPVEVDNHKQPRFALADGEAHSRVSSDSTMEQRELWDHVCSLWAMLKRRAPDEIRATLHPRYVGWDMSTEAPHDREAAVQSVLGDTPELRHYELNPLSVEVYDHRVGVAHYAYTATMILKDGSLLVRNGRWSEVYLKQNGKWQMISVSGRPD